MLTLAMQLNDVLCVCVGGGRIAERRIVNLLRENAKVIVISPTITEQIEQWYTTKQLEWHCSEYIYGMLPFARLVFIATDTPSVNEEVAKEAREKGALVNRADNLQDCDFTLPAETIVGSLRATISTDRVSPRINRLVANDFKERYAPLKDVLPLLKELRRQVKERSATSAEREMFWQQYLTADDLEKILTGHWYLVEEKLHRAISSIGIKSQDSTHSD